jgi:hypothetical protein
VSFFHWVFSFLPGPVFLFSLLETCQNRVRVKVRVRVRVRVRVGVGVRVRVRMIKSYLKVEPPPFLRL